MALSLTVSKKQYQIAPLYYIKNSNFFLIVTYHSSLYTLNVISWIRLTIITLDRYFYYPNGKVREIECK